MKVVFMGTPAFAVPSLEKLAGAGFTIEAVVTRPDRPRGRGQKLSSSPIKEKALALGLPVLQPEKVRESAFQDRLKELAPDVIAVVAFGQILPPEVLSLPPLGCINVHASLLPRLRGAAPIQRAILNGDKVTGVTTMYMAPELDSGDIILQEEEPIGEEDTAGTLGERLARRGAELLLATLKAVAAGRAPRRQQEEAEATYAPPITRADEVLNWEEPAPALVRRVRALNPEPGAVTWVGDKPVKVWRAHALAEYAGHPGRVLKVGTGGIVVGCGEGALLVEEVQPAGKRAMPAAAFANGYRVKEGDQWGR
ncbi:MAG: methionyl-tRNA formyltransferase [Bacillota bacterium]|nr:methionyl-tRNA formyltransferase [Bacillota bacterium]MDK2855074.1 methionyl-tRNA formyltransferase [Bacillota bacterium]MDK2925218.1 methionyl-tRNA formyltransferase [Bacillota bacterium]